MRSYVAIHMALIFAVGGLITGSIWAKASWGHWWVWNEPTLVSYLIVVLLFATYQPLRFSIEDPERQARYASVFAVVAGAFVPLNFIAVRLAQEFVHPRVLTLAGGHLPGSMRLTFFVSLIGIALLFATLWRYEMSAKNARMQTPAAAPHAARRRRARPRWAGARHRHDPLGGRARAPAAHRRQVRRRGLRRVPGPRPRLRRDHGHPPRPDRAGLAELVRDVQARRDDPASQAAEREIEQV